jgi:tRNA threonylcarbamoyladenosine biosynthesis protein TsaE
MAEYRISSQEELPILAEKLLSLATPGQFIALNGELGAGKTTFARYFLSYFGIRNVTSPTFTLVNVYQNSLPFYHFDFYRVNEIGELFDTGYYEYLNEGNGVMIVEWAELFPEALPARRVEIAMSVVDDLTRLIKVQTIG